MNWLKLLACPECEKRLSLEVFIPGGRIAQEGLLLCRSCRAWYPITNGIPRLLIPGPLRADDAAFLRRWKKQKPGPWMRTVRQARIKPKSHSESVQTQAQVQSVFEFKWKRQADWGIKNQTADFMEQWILNKYGWGSRPNYQRFMRDHGVMLDAGCGLGREALRMAKANPDAIVVGLELSACVDEAERHAREQGVFNILFVQGDLMSLPLTRRRFDFILSEGVLHHTVDTKLAFERLSRLLGDRGELAFYIYRKKAPLREYADDYVREQLQDVPLEKAWKMMEPLTRLGHVLAQQRIKIKVPEDIPVLGIRQGSADLQRWIYNTFFKCFWNEKLSFQENVLINFDWYLPRYAWRHSEEEVRTWLAGAKLTLAREHVEEAGITVRAVKNGGNPRGRIQRK